MLSIPHLIIIFVVALVVFGPEKLPELARTLGKVMGEFRRATGDLRSTFEGHLRDLEQEAARREAATSAAAQATASAAIEASSAPAIPAETAPGTVPASPPYAAAVSGAAEDEFPAQAPASAGASEAQVVLDSNEQHKQESEHQKTETVSDGGNRPA